MKKSYLLLLLILCLVITLVGCSKKQSVSVNNQESKRVTNNLTAETKKDKDDNIVLNITTKADSKYFYNNLDDLVKDSEIIVDGTVLETKAYISGPTVITEYKLQVKNSYNKSANTGDILTLVGAGGIITLEDALNLSGGIKDFEKDEVAKFSQEEKRIKKARYIFEGAPLVEVGKEYLIFAKKEKLIDGRELFAPVGTYQGHFNIVNNKVFREIPSTNLDSLEMDKDKFEQEVIKRVKNNTK